MEEKKIPFLLLTGASSGIGKVMAMMLSEHYNIILCGRDETRLNETKRLCKNENVLIWKFDLKNLSMIEASLSFFIENNNIRIAQFVHCAGYMKMLPLKMVTEGNIADTFNTNVISAILITKALMKKRINQGGLENIVFISSNISNMGAKAFSTYAASKGALDALMRCLAVELAPDVRVNSVLPGAIKTEMTENIYENKDVLARMEATYPLGLGAPEDVSEMVIFLLSEKAKWITGQQFMVDGGRTIDISG